MNPHDRQQARPVAIVTGAARRMGRAIALALADAGHDLLVHYGGSAAEAADVVREVVARGRRALAVQADLAQAAHTLPALFQRCRDELGEPSVLVNNASVFEYDSLDTLSADGLEQHMRINLLAPLIATRELAAGCKATGRQGVAVHLLDQKLFNPNPDFASYTLSKSALHQAVTLGAMAHAPHLRVVGVAPGLTMVSGDQTSAGFERAHQRTPLQRGSTPADIAAAVVFAVQCGSVTGTTLVVDGGQNLAGSPRDVMFLTGDDGRTGAPDATRP
ncbi:MAG: SDR family oxidoreductase [Burkholderiaceae bacterium]|nr:SDR family oxidoreductase [Burkholderiaceae bacterium]